MSKEELTPEQIASSGLLSYIGMQYPKYNAEPMHELIATALEAVEAGHIKRLLIFAPPQHGKCCDENTNILMSDGTSELAKDVKIGSRLSAYKDGKLIYARLLAKEPAEKESIRLTTKTGRDVIISHDHRMLTFNGYKKAEDITYSDFLLTIHTEIEHHNKIDENELKFITYMLFEGMCETDKTPHSTFSNIDPIVIKDFKTVCSNLKIHIKKTKGNECDYYVGCSSRILLDKYKIRGHRCTDKRLPKEFFSMPLKQRWLFIDLMFQTDGYFAQKAGSGGIALANKLLIEDIQMLLSSCGIATTKIFKPNNYSNAWILIIGRSQLPKIYKNCLLGSKREQCFKILQKKGHSKITAFPYEIGRRLKRTRENGFRCDNSKNITIEKLERMSKVYPELKKYLKMDFIYDQINNIEYVGKRKLVHLQTSRTNTYIANGLVSHNTMLTSEFFPAWAIGRNPDWKIIAATFNQTRANEVGGVVRDQFKGSIHKAVFPRCTVHPDIQSTQHIATEQRGHYYSIGLSGTGTGRGADCLPAETLIPTLIDGEKKNLDIVTIHLLQYHKEIAVLSLDHKTNKPTYKWVLASRRTFTDELYKITTNSGNNIRATENHRFFIAGRGYINAKDLQCKDRLTLSRSEQQNMPKQDTISSIKRISTKALPVYDIQVEGTSNFFANKILTHNCFLIDDPFKGREDAESKIGREKVREFYKSVAYSRLRPGGRIIIINTRWQIEDLSGYVLKEFPFENWKVIDLKAIAEEEDILGRKVGEALCPNMYPLKALNIMKEVQGTYNWESLYQQRPIPRKGGMIQYEWIDNNCYEKPPEDEDIIKTIISWDTAFRKGELNDPTAGTVWNITKNGYYLIDVFNKKLEFYKIIEKIKNLHEKYHPSAHLIEGRASGQPIIDELKRTTTLPIIEVSTQNLDKEVRLDSVSGLFESGKVHFPERAPWLIEAKDQLCLLPSYKFDDIADSVVHFLRWTNKPRYVRRPPSKLYWK